MTVLAREDAGAAGCADGVGGKYPIHAHPLFGDAVEVGRLVDLAAVTTDGLSGVVIRHDEEDVRPARAGIGGKGEIGEKWYGDHAGRVPKQGAPGHLERLIWHRTALLEHLQLYRARPVQEWGLCVSRPKLFSHPFGEHRIQ